MVHIFIEDKVDTKVGNFIKVYLKNINLPVPQIDSTNGYTNLHLVRIKFKENTDQGIKNIIIFDADDKLNKGSYSKRKQYLESKQKELDVNFECFLFPNNADDGDFELLLEKIINPKHKILLNCFESYEKCISQRKNSKGICIYNSLDRKSKMYSYINAFPKSNKIEERMKNKYDWFFDNPEFWDLDHQYLNNFKKFLLKQIK